LQAADEVGGREVNALGERAGGEAEGEGEVAAGAGNFIR